MKILSLDCSAVPCSAAIFEDEKIIASSFINVKLTHSQTLMPMVENLFKSSAITFSDIEGIAVTVGPGSFTGVRIGVSAAKGLAAPQNLPCVAVSTLFAMAHNFFDRDCIVCAVMDARCNQVYNALFKIENGTISRLCDDRALMCDELKSEIEEISKNNDKDIIIVGDGTDLFFPFVADIKKVKKAAENKKYQNATGVGAAALPDFKAGNTVSAATLLPKYLRLPQAERELKLKRSKNI